MFKLMTVGNLKLNSYKRLLIKVLGGKIKLKFNNSIEEALLGVITKQN